MPICYDKVLFAYQKKYKVITGFAKWHRFPVKVGQLSYSSTQTICSGDFDDGQLLAQPDGWLLTTSEVGLGRETNWFCDRTGNKQAITEVQNAVETLATKIGSDLYFYEEKDFQLPILLKTGTHQNRNNNYDSQNRYYPFITTSFW